MSETVTKPKSKPIVVSLAYLNAKRLTEICDRLVGIDRRAFVRAYRKLPQGWQDILASRRVIGMSRLETAQVEGCPESEIAHRERKGLAMLCEKFAEYSGIPVKVNHYRNQV
jgi:DNA-directed RNA polymerase specialized sigma24 family protein